mmetsp:Transcript_104207/g.301446  ORF Transcript_104207/g.301446 Transcript_104207/m.301446 type:complete len:100 (+) Transcript_104207:126-425(+)
MQLARQKIHITESWTGSTNYVYFSNLHVGPVVMSSVVKPRVKPNLGSCSVNYSMWCAKCRSSSKIARPQACRLVVDRPCVRGDLTGRDRAERAAVPGRA